MRYPDSETAKQIEREWSAARDAGRSSVDTSDEEDEVDMVRLRAMRAEANEPIGQALRTLQPKEKVQVVRQANQRSLAAASNLGKRKRNSM